MVLYRSLTLGLLGACLYLIVGLPPRTSHERGTMSHADTGMPAMSVVDVAHGVSPELLTTVVRLAVDERVIAVGDQPVANDLAAGAAIAARSVAPGRYLDLTVAGASGTRRILVLMH